MIDSIADAVLTLTLLVVGAVVVGYLLFLVWDTVGTFRE